ncbi:MAG: flippase-like domain-containing protein [Desulfobacterales bacterium]|nr:MAG: flippase-like domain-containing protein [Desulfobacterales bacterium]
MKTVIRLLLLFLGLILFSWFVYQAGPDEILRGFGRLGWLTPLILIPFGFVYYADTLGWLFAFGAKFRPQLPFLTLLRIRWAGEAVNSVVPSAYIGGEALKVYLLRKKGVPMAHATSSVVVGKTMQTLSQLVFIGLGAAAFLPLVVPDSGFRLGMLLVLAGSFAIVGVLFWLQSQGMFAILLGLLSKLKIRMASVETHKAKLEHIDHQISEFYRRDRKHFALSASAYFGGWIMDTMEIFLAAYLLGMPIFWTQALAVEAFVSIAKFLGLFVPGALGVQESGIVFLCRTAGLPEAFGVTYALIRRGREVVYAAIGWGIFYAEEAALKGLGERMASSRTNSA